MGDSTITADRVRAIDAFSGLGDEELEQAASLARERTYEQGDELLHLDECTGEVQRLVPDMGAAPAVLVVADGRTEVLLGADELEPVAGDVAAFERVLREALAARSLVLG